jgi:peptidoglycan/LPS O-acetylase OafA/YrhL
MHHAASSPVLIVDRFAMSDLPQHGETGQTIDSGHIPALDGVRGVAIAMVVAFHSGLLINGSNSGEQFWLRAVGMGWAGVDLFFVLSGFLISTILIQTRDSTHYFRNFYVRRILRIFPLYYGSLLLLVKFDDHGRHVWYWAFAQNWLAVTEGVVPPTILQPYWSLAVEEQFYLVWPLVIWCIPPRHLSLFCALTALFSLVCRCIAHAQGVDYWILMTVTPFRLDALAIGSLVAACCYGEQRSRLARLAPLILAGCLGGILAIEFLGGGYQLNGALTQTVGYTLFALLCAALIAMVVEGHALARPLCRLLEWQPLRHLGNRSYAMYVFHMPLLVFVKSYYLIRLQATDTGTADVWAFLFAVVLLLVGAELSWHLFEKQFLKLKRYFPR